MKEMYITGSYKSLIEKVNVTRETEQTIWYNDAKCGEQSQRKVSSSKKVHISFEDAKEYLLNQNRNELERLIRNSNLIEERIKIIESLQNTL